MFYVRNSIFLFATKSYMIMFSSVVASDFKKILLACLKCISYYETNIRFLGNSIKNKNMWFYDVIVDRHSNRCCVQTITIKSELVNRKRSNEYGYKPAQATK